jgi:uncharacterized protein (UPF0332 family)
MVKLDWCIKQKKGILLIEPNDNLAQEYIKSAEETLLSLNNSEDSNMWKATKKYYAQYLAIYALCMKIGIKCEIHDCTIELINYLDKFNIFPKESYHLLKKDKQLRIDNQYYLKNIPITINYEKIQTFILTCKEKIHSLNMVEIKLIRKKLREI